jgi:hypothetical protein
MDSHLCNQRRRLAAAILAQRKSTEVDFTDANNRRMQAAEVDATAYRQKTAKAASATITSVIS